MTSEPWDIDDGDVADLARRLVACGSPNPPGDVSEIAWVVRRYLSAHGLPCRVDRATSDRVNLVCTVDSGAPGRHVVLSGHLDTFPIDPRQAHGQRGRDGRDVFGRGIADMLGGVAGALVFLQRLARATTSWGGRVSAVLVCDEESFGPHGARRLLADRSLLDVDAVLTAEPSGRGCIRYGERGPVWGTLAFGGRSGHAGYPHEGPNAIERAAELVTRLRSDFHRAFGPSIDPTPDAPGVSLSVSTIHGGTKVNTHPTDCAFEVDVRVPGGVAAADVVDWLKGTAESHGGSYRADVADDANASDSNHPVFAAMVKAVRAEIGVEPQLEIARGSTDGRHWRRHGVPVAHYGADPLMQATPDEHVSAEELGEIARVHARTAWAVLTDLTFDRS